MSKQVIDDFFSKLTDIYNTASPADKKYLETGLEAFSKTVLGREWKKATGRSHLPEDVQELLRAQDRERQNRRRAKMTPEQRDQEREKNATSMVQVRARKKKGTEPSGP